MLINIVSRCMKDPNKKYSIKAYYTPTKRFRTVIQIGSSEEVCYENMRKEGYTDPFEAMEIFDDPTEAQLNYAANLGIKVPADATKQDVSAMLDFKENNDNAPNVRLLSFAYQQNLYVSKYIGEERLYDFLFEALDLPIKIVFFIFSIYEHSTKTRTYNPNEHPLKASFVDFSNLYVSDDRFVKSMNRYRGSDLRYFGETNLGDHEYSFGGSRDTIAYKAAINFLRSRGLVAPPASRPAPSKTYTYHQQTPHINSDFRESKSGCFRQAVIVGVILFVLFKFISCLS